MRTYTAKSAMTLSLWEGGGEIGVEAVITYRVSRYYPATLESPEEPSEADVVSFRLYDPKKCEVLSCPPWIVEQFEGDSSFLSWLVQEAAEQDAAARDDAADHRREMLRDERL